MTLTAESEALLDLLAPDVPDVTVHGWRDRLRSRLAAIEAAALVRAAMSITEAYVLGRADADAALRARVAALAAALVTIRDQGGAVCPDFESCRHVSCRSSYAAWHVADMALSPEEPR